MRPTSSTSYSCEIRTRGFGLVEIVVSLALLLLFATAFAGAITYGEESATISGMHNRASFYADEGVEAVRNIRDNSYSNLLMGTYGVSTSTGAWTLSGTSNTNGIFTRTITISPNDASSRKVTVSVTWPENAVRSGSTTEITYLSNLGQLSTQASNLKIYSGSSLLTGVTSNSLQGITLQDIGSSPVIIDKVTISWTNALNKIQELDIGGSAVWKSTGVGTPIGTQSSGVPLDITDVTLQPTATSTTAINQFLFTGSMLLNVFTITATMKDGSTKTITTLQL